MTTPNRQLPQVKSKVQTEDTKLPWYRSFIVWLGIALTVFIFAGCVHFLYVGAQLRGQENSLKTPEKKKELTHILGVPISASSISTTEKKERSEKDTDDSL